MFNWNIILSQNSFVYVSQAIELWINLAFFLQEKKHTHTPIHVSSYRYRIESTICACYAMIVINGESVWKRERKNYEKKYIIKRMQFHIKPYVMNDCHIIHSVLFSTYYLCKYFLLWHFCYGTSIFFCIQCFFLFRFHVTKIVSISKNFQYTHAQQHTRCQ